MKKISIFIIVIIIEILVLSSCTVVTYIKYNTDMVSDFNKSLKNDFKSIKSIQYGYSPSSLRIIYIMDKDTYENDVNDIFIKTKEFVVNKDFLEDFFDTFFSKYYNEENIEKVYPDINIIFDIGNDDKIDYKYSSMYYKNPYISGSENIIDEYKKWYSWDEKNGEKIVLD